VRRAGAALLWFGVGCAKMVALASLIDGDWRLALTALLAAWTMAAAALVLRGLRRA
jgi:hypothetical protein